MLDQDERVALISSFSSFVPEAQTSNLASRMEDWFKMDAGALLKWDKDKIDAFVSKLEFLTPTQTMGIICWALGFWNHLDLVDPVDIEAYAEDFARLI